MQLRLCLVLVVIHAASKPSSTPDGFKNRPVEKGLILVAAAYQQLEAFADFDALSADSQEMIKKTWPGPMTWVVPAQKGVSLWLTGGRNTIAVRVSAHPQVQALCQAFRCPITSTSANRSGDRLVVQTRCPSTVSARVYPQWPGWHIGATHTDS